MTRKTRFSVEIDLDAGAAYVTMTDREVASTELLGAGVNVDLDEFRVVVGVELLTLEAEIPFDTLTNEFHVHSADVDRLKALRPSIAESVLHIGTDGTTTPTKALKHLPLVEA